MRISVNEIWRKLDGLPKINTGDTKCFGFSSLCVLLKGGYRVEFVRVGITLEFALEYFN